MLLRHCFVRGEFKFRGCLRAIVVKNCSNTTRVCVCVCVCVCLWTVDEVKVTADVRFTPVSLSKLFALPVT